MGSEQHAHAGQTASENGDPAVDLRGLECREDPGRASLAKTNIHSVVASAWLGHRFDVGIADRIQHIGGQTLKVVLIVEILQFAARSTGRPI